MEIISTTKRVKHLGTVYEVTFSGLHGGQTVIVRSPLQERQFRCSPNRRLGTNRMAEEAVLHFLQTIENEQEKLRSKLDA